MPSINYTYFSLNKYIYVLVGSIFMAACSNTPEDSIFNPSNALDSFDLHSDALSDGQPGPQLAKLPARNFKMGCYIEEDCYYDDTAVRVVTIPAGVSIMTHEVTFNQYDKFAKDVGAELPDDSGWGRGDRPVINVAWNEAETFAQWVSEQTGQKYSLPSEAVWEYAARAMTSTDFFFGNDVTQLCQYGNVADITEGLQRKGKPLVNCNDGFGRLTAPVQEFKPNAFGLYDMSGNVREWVQDCYHDSYENAPIDGSARLDDCNTEDKVLRGGAWFSFPWITSASTRQSDSPFVASFSIGFRLMRVENNVESE